MNYIKNYLSKAIATKCKMEEVQTKTSTLIQKSHNVTPRFHSCITVDQAPKGVTIKPTIKSALANDNINKYCGRERKSRSRTIAVMTNKLPITQKRISINNKHPMATLCQKFNCGPTSKNFIKILFYFK